MGNGFDTSTQQATLEAEDEAVAVHICGADDKPLFWTDGEGKERPVLIYTTGIHSRRHRRAEETIRRRKIRPGKLTGETFFEDQIEKAVACVTGWEGFFADGKPLEPTRENVSQIYRTYTFVYDQVMEVMNDHARFSRASSGTH